MLCQCLATTGKDVLTIRPGFFRAGNAAGILAVPAFYAEASAKGSQVFFTMLPID